LSSPDICIKLRDQVRIDIVGTTYTQILAIVFISRVQLTLNFIKLITLTLLLPSFPVNQCNSKVANIVVHLLVGPVNVLNEDQGQLLIPIKFGEMGGLVLPKKLPFTLFRVSSPRM